MNKTTMKDRTQQYKDYRDNNKDVVRASKKKWRDGNEEAYQEYQREYRRKNKDKLNERKREYRKKRKLADANFKLRGNLSTRLYYAVKDQGTTKDSTTMKLTGCTLRALVSHLESQFTEGMTWENYGQWHVDHMRPCASFDLTLDGEQGKCFHYTNLQPLWAADNLKKSDKYE
tara:strand:+ start:32 stop:550 length:519 start_codon:yes stop_codon:yes gene_type:complete